tara:strand:- start:631 stop:1080 length:450 start_codon:yes stop_codon:yes gene_type:complete
MSELIQQLDQDGQNDDINKRKLAELKQQAKARIKKKVQDKAKKKIKELQKKAILKATKGGAGATLVGLIITYAIMTIQFIAGNIFESKIIPKLGFAETIIWACATILIIICTIASITILIMMAMGAISVACPVCAISIFGEEILAMIGF